jgi:hypothetical protein
MLQPLMIGQRPTPSLSSHFGSRRAWKFASQAYSAIPLLHSLSMSPQLASPRQVCGEWPSTGQKGGQIESRFDTYTVKPDKQLDRRDLGLLQSVADPSRPDVELGAVLPEMLRLGTILLFSEVSNTSTDDGLAATFSLHTSGMHGLLPRIKM